MLYVSDVARSKEFYTRVLNAKVLPDFASEGFAMLQLPDSPPLALFAVSGGLPPGVKASPGGFELDLEVEDLEATYKDWEAKNKVDPFVKTGGRAVVRATFLLFLSLYRLFYNLLIVLSIKYTSAGVR